MPICGVPPTYRQAGSSLVACALKRFGAQASLQRTSKYASLLGISGALHLNIFEQPEKMKVVPRQSLSFEKIEKLAQTVLV